MKHFMTGGATLILFAALSACSRTVDDMSCADSDITSTVMELSRESLRKPLLLNHIMQFSDSVTPFVEVRNMDYPSIIKHIEKNPSDVYSKSLEATDSTLETLHLEDIRIKDRDSQSKKLSCVANLAGRTKVEIQYTAQLTESEEVYIEVYGLE